MSSNGRSAVQLVEYQIYALIIADWNCVKIVKIRQEKQGYRNIKWLSFYIPQGISVFGSNANSYMNFEGHT